MRPGAFFYFYTRRIRTHPVQELLAGVGVAIGVALAFAVMVANASISRSSRELTDTLAGHASLQLQARSAHGFDAATFARVRSIPGVQHAAPLLEQRVVLTSRGKREPVQLVGLDSRIAALSDIAPRTLASTGIALNHGIVLSAAAAHAIAITATQHRRRRIQVAVGGEAFAVPLGGVIGSKTAGSLSHASVAILPLAQMQTLSHMDGRVTRILIETDSAQATAARRGLVALAHAQHLTLSRPDAENRLLRQALGPSGQATGFFAGVAVLLGFLLAFSAILITAPERRSTVVDLRVYSAFKARQLLSISVFQALVLGVLSSAAGVLVGIPISQTILRESPDYLSAAFVLGDRTVVGAFPVIAALAGGTLACCLASVLPLIDLRRGRPLDALLEGRRASSDTVRLRTRTQMLAGSALMVVMATVLLLTVPKAALAATSLLAIGTVLLIPAAFAGLLRVLDLLIVRFDRLGMLTIAVFALRATRFRALALAATGTVAVFGSVAIGSARDDLLRGIAGYTSDYVSTADIWVTNLDDNQATNAIRTPGIMRRVAAVAGVDTVRAYRGSYLDVDDRRLWVIARSTADASMLPASQVISGNLASATARLRAGGWAAVSDQIAKTRRLTIGGILRLPTPTGQAQYRVAAVVTNLGWAPGTVILNSSDYKRAWGSDDPSALEVDVAPGASVAGTRAAVAHAIGAGAGLQIQTAPQRAGDIYASARLGLLRLGQISRMLLVAAVLAMVAAMGAAIWQSRLGFAGLRLQHFRPSQIWVIVLLESGIMLTTGYVTGVVIGTYGQVVIDRYLDLVTGFPLVIQLVSLRTFETLAAGLGAAIAVTAGLGVFAARAPATLALGEDLDIQ